LIGLGTVCGPRSTEFERRSALYSRLDLQLCDQTRFFAAAALVNAVFATLFQLWSAIRPPRSFNFLNEVGAALETDNLRYARAITAHTPGDSLDYALVCAEQARLQCYVRAHQALRPRQWESIRRELNGLLNDRYAIALFSRWGKGGARLYRVLHEVRERLGTTLDFSTESHRIRIGLRLIEHFRQERSSMEGKVLPCAGFDIASTLPRRGFVYASLNSRAAG
jgi:hypothetical protein